MRVRRASAATDTLAITAPTHCNTATFKVSIAPPTAGWQEMLTFPGPGGVPTMVPGPITTTFGSASYVVTLEIGDQDTSSSLTNLISLNSTLSPTCVPGTTTYSTSILSTQTTVNLNPVFGTVQYVTSALNGAAATMIDSGLGRNFAMNTGLNTVVFQVCAQDGTMTDYTVNITRAAPPPANAAPTDIILSATTIAENNAPGATIGTLTATDADVGDTHTFAFATGTGDADNAAFTLTGNTLSINASADFETKSSYTIRLRATDNGAGNLSFEQVLRLTISDVADTPAGVWRETYFGTTANTGNTGDNGDFDNDGVSNLMEFALGTDPTSNSSGNPALQYSGTLAGGGAIVATGQPTTVIETIATGVDFRGLFSRRKDYQTAGLIYTPQFSNDMITWENSPANPVVLADDGVNQIVSVPYTRILSSGKKARFFRLSVSAN